jgi:glycine cleavage system T protein
MPEVARSPLAGIYHTLGSKLGDYHGVELPLRFSEPAAEHQAVRQAAGYFDFSHRARFAATGTDHVSFLHNMLSNDVKALAPGQGVYATLLDVKGHILADVRVYRDRDQVLLETDADLRAKAMQTLERYIIMDDVTLRPLDQFSMAFQGPQARALVERVVRAALPNLHNEYDHIMAALPGGEGVRVVKATSTGDEGYELWAGASTLAHLWEAAGQEAGSFGALPCGTEALESLRIEAGIPRYGAELGEDTLPLEAGLLNALSFTKGCYIGQEIVERARSRGHVNWKLVGLTVDSATQPAPGEKLLSQSKEVGEITSSCVSPIVNKILALAYVRREASEPGTKLILGSGPSGEVTALPFISSNR